ncbi:MAG TPA: TAT-variant-translocated molybdopterin oxidoreductase [Fimbriimonadaceae bacterium]|nr:TAT-variant-translocated molybdopterin oxidoreductase [Fimbriimonadaceae bacterium]
MEAKEPKKLDLDAIRAKLASKQGPKYWRGLEEVAETPEFTAWLGDEFPNRSTLLQIDRRSLLKVMGASMALAGLSGCRGVFLDEEKIVPYVKQPEEMVLGKPLYFATAAPYPGYGVGFLVESREGRPLKIEGNPDHPESQGSTTAIHQAEILNFYDPDRSQNVMSQGEISTWDVFYAEASKMLADQKAKKGSGLRILTETIASPLLAEQIKDFLAVYPNAKWYQYDACGADSAKQAAVGAFGKPVNTIYDLKKAKVIVSLDSDFLMDGPGTLRYARDFADGRRVMGDNTEMNRLYAIESYPTITGASSDHRFRVRGSDIEAVAFALAAALGVQVNGSSQAAGISADNIAAIANDLRANHGAAVVIPGAHQSPNVHLLCHAINNGIGALGSTALLVPSFDESPQSQVAGLKELTDDLNGKRVDALLIIGGNPVYNAPVDFQFDRAIQNCPFTVHHSLYNDETSEKCVWHLPHTHFLEQWGDVRAYDGTISLIQPLIAPLFESRSAHQLFGVFLGKSEDGYALLKKSYEGKSLLVENSNVTGEMSTEAPKQRFENAWKKVLHDGVIPKTSYAPLSLPFIANAVQSITPRTPINGIEVILKADPTIGDGRHANNGWLQELAKPLIKTTWENTIILSPRTAQQYSLQTDDEAEVVVSAQSISGTVWIMPGHPDDSITIHLGYGRTKGGAVANGVGFNAYVLRHSDAMSFAAAESVKKTGDQSGDVAATQVHNTMEGRDLIRMGTVADYKKNPSLYEEEEHVHVDQTHPEFQSENVSLYPDEIFNYDGPQWGMTVDLNTCIGCNACVIACQAENNIPVVGKKQVLRAREMQWIRIDRYFTSPTDSGIHWDIGDFTPDPIADPTFSFQPVMCQHCEKAPCEPVCPVGATMHSHEGLNQMVYNRCVGTRYCSNNCPYKVRRFNFLNYTDNQAQFDATDEENPMRVPLLRLLNNPDVTVRGRGVMEKCTFCVQRINGVRIEAKKLGRDPKDGEIITACQQACPTKTIVFGNVADKDSKVSKIRGDKRAYQLLREVQTRPRVSYLGKIRNVNPEIKA